MYGIVYGEKYTTCYTLVYIYSAKMMWPKQLLTSVFSGFGLLSEHHPVTRLRHHQCYSVQDCRREYSKVSVYK